MNDPWEAPAATLSQRDPWEAPQRKEGKRSLAQNLSMTGAKAIPAANWSLLARQVMGAVNPMGTAEVNPMAVLRGGEELVRQGVNAVPTAITGRNVEVLPPGIFQQSPVPDFFKADPGENVEFAPKTRAGQLLEEQQAAVTPGMMGNLWAPGLNSFSGAMSLDPLGPKVIRPPAVIPEPGLAEKALPYAAAPLKTANDLLRMIYSPEGALMFTPFAPGLAATRVAPILPATRAAIVTDMAGHVPENVAQRFTEAGQNYNEPGSVTKAILGSAVDVGIPLLGGHGVLPRETPPTYPWMKRVQEPLAHPDVPSGAQPTEFPPNKPFNFQSGLNFDQWKDAIAKLVMHGEYLKMKQEDGPLSPKEESRLQMGEAAINRLMTDYPDFRKVAEQGDSGFPPVGPGLKMNSGLNPEDLRPAVRALGRILVGDVGDTHAEILTKNGIDPSAIPHHDPNRGFVDINNPDQLISRVDAARNSGLTGKADAGGLDSMDLPGAGMAKLMRMSGMDEKGIQDAISKLRPNRATEAQAPRDIQKVGEEIRPGTEGEGVVRPEESSKGGTEEPWVRPRTKLQSGFDPEDIAKAVKAGMNYGLGKLKQTHGPEVPQFLFRVGKDKKSAEEITDHYELAQAMNAVGEKHHWITKDGKVEESKLPEGTHYLSAMKKLKKKNFDAEPETEEVKDAYAKMRARGYARVIEQGNKVFIKGEANPTQIEAAKTLAEKKGGSAYYKDTEIYPNDERVTPEEERNPWLDEQDMGERWTQDEGRDFGEGRFYSGLPIPSLKDIPGFDKLVSGAQRWMHGALDHSHLRERASQLLDAADNSAHLEAHAAINEIRKMPPAAQRRGLYQAYTRQQVAEASAGINSRKVDRQALKLADRKNITDKIDRMELRLTQGQLALKHREYVDELGKLRTIGGDPFLRKLPGKGKYPPKGYTEMEMFGIRRAVKDDFVWLVKALTSESASNYMPVLDRFLHLEATIKHNTLAYDFFHLIRMVKRQMAIKGGLPSYEKGHSLLEYNDRTINRMVSTGEMTKDMADWVKNNRPDAQLLVKNGLNIARFSDAFYKDQISYLPGVKTLNKFIFDKFTRGAMLEAALTEMKRYSERNPGLSKEQVAQHVAKQINVTFGNIGRQGLLKSETARDIARLLFLAPQWFESLAQIEARAAKQTAQIPVTGQGGTAARMVATSFVAMFAVNQAINMMTRGKPTWENEEKGRKLDAYIPSWTKDAKGLWLSPWSEMEVSHDAAGYLKKGNTPMQTVQRIVTNKLSPVGRAEEVLRTGRDFTGAPLSDSERWDLAGMSLLPVPIPAQSVISEVPGQVQRQAMNTLGFKGEPVGRREELETKIEKATLPQRLRLEQEFKANEPPVTGRQKVAMQERAVIENTRRGLALQDSLPKEDRQWLKDRGLDLPGVENYLTIAGVRTTLSAEEQEKYEEFLRDGYTKAIETLKRNYDKVPQGMAQRKVFTSVIAAYSSIARKKMMAELARKNRDLAL